MPRTILRGILFLLIKKSVNELKRLIFILV